jgi:hypothetical protein
MEAQPGLARLQHVGEYTDALLALRQALNNFQARFVGQSMKPAGGNFSILQRNGHEELIYQQNLICQAELACRKNNLMG